MATRMLIDATHPEETRVVVVKGNRLEEFDFETSTKKPLKGNIYLAKVTRVEPALQAAFVEYGGNRHGFLAFSEIHPDYYQIPVADRQKLLELQAEEDAAYNAEPDVDTETDDLAAEDRTAETPSNVEEIDTGDIEIEEIGGGMEAEAAMPLANPTDMVKADLASSHTPSFLSVSQDVSTPSAEERPDDQPMPASSDSNSAAVASDVIVFPAPDHGLINEFGQSEPAQAISHDPAGDNMLADMSGDDAEEGRDAARKRRNALRGYKIQEVIKRRQIMLVQVVKEERGNKGAALTSYISLPGRYCVLMPNSARGGGISRKIANPNDRKRLKSIVDELDVPNGMGVILRTAGMDRQKQEIKRDFDYLLRLWDSVRELTLRSQAPCLVYEEGNLIKRSIRDYYSNEIEDILIEGEQGYNAARDFMGLIMPNHVDRIRLYREPGMRLFHRYQVEQQFDSMYSPTVSLRSGGYIVINPTEALVSIDVNSGKSTREHNIEETAYKTNLEAAEEIARQLRLRDLAGLIVIDFIDMEDSRNNRNVERRLKDCLKADRARIQVGRISPFGLLEMSRQRLRPSLLESSTKVCPHCVGLGYIRSTESTSLLVLRAIEEEASRERSTELTVQVATSVALYILNAKRDAVQAIESRYGLRIIFEGDDSLIPPAHKIERTKVRQSAPIAARTVINTESVRPLDVDEFTDTEIDEENESEADDLETTESINNTDSDNDGRKRRRRRRRRRRRNDEGEDTIDQSLGASADNNLPEGGEQSETDGSYSSGEDTAENDNQGDTDDDRPRRRRGRRGGRRRQKRPEDGGSYSEQQSTPNHEANLHDSGNAAPIFSTIDLSAAAAQTAPLPSTAPEGVQVTGAISETSPAEISAESSTENQPRPRRFGWWRRKGSE